MEEIEAADYDKTLYSRRRRISIFGENSTLERKYSTMQYLLQKKVWTAFIQDIVEQIAKEGIGGEIIFLYFLNKVIITITISIRNLELYKKNCSLFQNMSLSSSITDF